MNGIRVCLLLLLSVVCYSDTLPLVRGHVEGDLPPWGNEMIVELLDFDRHGAGQQAIVANDGSFEFRYVTAGRYNLRLRTFHGDAICEQMVDLFTFSGELSIRLPKRARARPVSGTVSVRELQRPVPQKAFRAFVDAQRETQSGRAVEAVRKLELAVRLYPEFADARSNLGVEYIRLRRYRDALEQFEKAVASGAPSAMLYGNLCYAYWALGRFEEAEQSARRAVSTDDRYGRAHYLLGSLLERNVRSGDLRKAPEAAHHLRQGATDVPHAHIEIAQIYLTEGDPLGAAEELRLYLKSGDASARADAQRWLAELSGKPLTQE